MNLKAKDKRINSREEFRVLNGIAEEKIPVLSVNVIPGKQTNASELAFRWNVTK